MALLLIGPIRSLGRKYSFMNTAPGSDVIKKFPNLPFFGQWFCPHLPLILGNYFAHICSFILPTLLISSPLICLPILTTYFISYFSHFTHLFWPMTLPTLFGHFLPTLPICFTLICLLILPTYFLYLILPTFSTYFAHFTELLPI